MPLTLNVGLSKKIGEANYGSRGASVHFEVELEHTLVRQPDELKEKIRYLFAQAKEAVEEELAGGGQDHAGEANANNGSRRFSNGRQATASQCRAIHAIASRNRVDLPSRLRDRFGVDEPTDLLIGQASELIDELKGTSNGAGGSR